MFLGIRNKYEHKHTKKKLLPKDTQRYASSKIATSETLSAMPQSQNSIGNWPFSTVFWYP